MRVRQAVILAAGKGTRMRELTVDIPKPMVAVGGRPILERIINGLQAAGVRRFLIVVGYRKEVIEDHFMDGSNFGTEIRYVEQVLQDGTGKVVSLAEPFCGADPFILSYGDILVDFSFYRQLVELADDDEMLISVKARQDVSKGGTVFLDSNQRVIDLQEKQNRPMSGTHWYNAGIYAFRSSIFPYVARLQKSTRGEYELTDAVRELAQATRRARAVEISGDWADVRDPEVLSELNQQALAKEPGRGH
jgi:UDP-N-acetylglucosamine diphosphorylase / glucose-1-phosphate thymidylyltransferase / UDP-N-acetylgalactosamine diphosphorylase / glucosamine-1-phosphate N-acetyltransferase / galactosamine-1-phosphate N-acetyltransferase